MAFDLRCPDCNAKLRLDDEPEPDVAVECPKCGSTFTADESAPVEEAPRRGTRKKKGKGVPVGPDGKPLPKEARERTFFNPFLLLAIILTCLATYVGVCWAVLDQLGKSGRVTDMVAYLPKECNTARGVSLETLTRYPGYKSEADKYLTPTLRSTLDALAQANKVPARAFLDYLVCGRSRDGKSVNVTVYVIRCVRDIKRDAILTGLSGQDEAIGSGRPALRLPPSAPGILSGALLDFPTRRHVIVVPRQGNVDQAHTLSLSRAASEDHRRSFVSDLGDAGDMVIRGHAWLVVKATGDNASIPADLSEKLKNDLSVLSQAMASTKVIGMWNSFGVSVRFGGAIDCGSSSTASSVAKTLKEGPMGQGDAAEIPRGVKNLIAFATSKEFLILMSALSFRTSGTCAYYTTSAQGEAAQMSMNYANLPTLVDGGFEK